MINKLKDMRGLLGLIFTIASGIITVVLGDAFFFDEPRLRPFLYDAGVDALGALACAALYFGSMKQKGVGSSEFRTLTVLVSVGFLQICSCLTAD